MAVSAHPVVFSHLLPSHTWQATCINCGEKCESDSQLSLYCSVIGRRRKLTYNPHVWHSGYCMYHLLQTLTHLASTSKKTHYVLITKTKRKNLKETVTDCYISYGIDQSFRKCFLLSESSKNKHGSSHPC